MKFCRACISLDIINWRVYGVASRSVQCCSFGCSFAIPYASSTDALRYKSDSHYVSDMVAPLRAPRCSSEAALPIAQGKLFSSTTDASGLSCSITVPPSRRGLHSNGSGQWNLEQPSWRRCGHNYSCEV